LLLIFGQVLFILIGLHQGHPAGGREVGAKEKLNNNICNHPKKYFMPTHLKTTIFTMSMGLDRNNT
jgi:hypothetical protein